MCVQKQALPALHSAGQSKVGYRYQAMRALRQRAGGKKSRRQGAGAGKENPITWAASGQVASAKGDLVPPPHPYNTEANTQLQVAQRTTRRDAKLLFLLQATALPAHLQTIHTQTCGLRSAGGSTCSVTSQKGSARRALWAEGHTHTHRHMSGRPRLRAWHRRCLSQGTQAWPPSSTYCCRAGATCRHSL